MACNGETSGKGRFSGHLILGETMTLEQIKSAVLNGKTVHWKNESYEVGQMLDYWHIACVHNANYIGLTHQDGVTMNGQPEDFYIGSDT
jgi:hypothetical protein